MPCFSPVQGYRTPSGTIQESPRGAYTDLGIITRKCGWCIGCRLDKSREWAIRCVHEASLHERNCFVTLTYAPENLPEGGTLRKDHIQKFMKRLRKKFGEGIRYYYCGEYGEKTSRPHYHLALFNHDFDDKGKAFPLTKQTWSGRKEQKYDGPWQVRNGYPVWRSKQLEKLWTKGNSEIGTLTFESAAYIARYITKKIVGKKPRKCKRTGRWIDPEKHYSGKLPEFTDMSRGSKALGTGGIGKTWYEKNWNDVFPADSLIIFRNGKPIEVKPPKFYLHLYDVTDPDGYISPIDGETWHSPRAEKIKNERKYEAKNKKEESTLRTHQKEMHAEKINNHSPRRFEDGTENLYSV